MANRKTPPPKSLSMAYTWAVLGLVLGYCGAHRHYLRHSGSGVVLSLLLLVGVVFFVAGLLSAGFSAYADYLNAQPQLIEKMLQSAEQPGAGQQALEQELDGIMDKLTPLIEDKMQEQTTLTNIGFLLMGVAFIWWVLDLFGMRRLLRRCNDDINKAN